MSSPCSCKHEGAHENTQVEENSNYETLTALVYFARYLLLLIIICLFGISLLYSISSLVTLEATHFFCPIYTEEQVRQHNLENNLAKGEGSLSCWYIERSKIDFNAVESLDIDVFEANFDCYTTLDAIICAVYSLISLYLLIITLYHGYYLLFDTFYAILACFLNTNSKSCSWCCCNLRKNVNVVNTDNNNQLAATIHHQGIVDTKNPRITQVLNQMRLKAKHADKLNRHAARHSRHSDRENIDKFIKHRRVAIQQKKKNCLAYAMSLFAEWYKKCGLWVVNNYYTDSKYRLFGIIGREWLEILIQTYGLFYYGGINLFNKESNVPAQDPIVVRGKYIQCARSGLFVNVCCLAAIDKPAHLVFLLWFRRGFSFFVFCFCFFLVPFEIFQNFV